ncbi:hypothetical protein [Reyranella sp. CPCC 100927]|uniref:hypothetical protein n=1 Tax=Reyranella sp. CPCC 100927 TaxID=2599616 RepID=UPI0011B5AF29|nr:hypothetical protein [Reyranella sp. CPCC 100927]TWT05926.1 hypothetical protein FQU96_22990 [Reyranella sp. CPCC 100927]
MYAVVIRVTLVTLLGATSAPSVAASVHLPVDSMSGLPETSKTHLDPGSVRVQVEMQDGRIRLLTAAIEAAVLARRFEDADRLMIEGLTRYPAYEGWADYRHRLAAARQRDEQQEREQSNRREQAKALVSEAYRMAAQGNYNRAAAILTDANELAPGLPGIAVARADIIRQRIDSQRQGDRLRQDGEIRDIATAIEVAIAGNRIADAERIVAEASRHHTTHPGWDSLQRRVANARQAADTEATATKPIDELAKENRQLTARAWELLTQYREAMARNDLDTAERAVIEAEGIGGGSSEVVAARAEWAAAKRREHGKD